MERSLHIKPRYYRWHVDPGVEWIETNTGYAQLDWEIPISQAALVMVDVWDRHYLKDTEARAESIIQERIVPLVPKCREAGLQIIHAPSPKLAEEHPAWVGAVENENGQWDGWPSHDFRNKTGVYKPYARPVEPRGAERDEHVSKLTMHPSVLPEGDDVVIANGAELHQYCKRKGILFLFYLGFNTNACILLRPYGTIRMHERGYEIIIVRDCGTGMESFETHDDLWQTRGAILFLEMYGKYSISSEELTASLK